MPFCATTFSASLKIDTGCTQIAAFNLAFAAWRMTGHRPPPALNLTCSSLGRNVGEGMAASGEEDRRGRRPAAACDLFGGKETLLTAGVEKRARNGLDVLHGLFAKVPALGSLIDPRRAGGPPDDGFRNAGAVVRGGSRGGGE